jgi:hypothetical protein
MVEKFAEHYFVSWRNIEEKRTAQVDLIFPKKWFCCNGGDFEKLRRMKLLPPMLQFFSWKFCENLSSFSLSKSLKNNLLIFMNIFFSKNEIHRWHLTVSRLAAKYFPMKNLPFVTLSFKLGNVIESMTLPMDKILIIKQVPSKYI